MSIAHAKRLAAAPRSHAPAGAPDADADRDFCATMLPRVSRTFALSIAALPERLREPVRVAYLLCRAVDTIEDDARIVGAPRERLYDCFDALLADDGRDVTAFEALSAELDLGAGTHDAELCLNSGAVFRCFRALPARQRAAIRPHVAEMSRGMREFTRRADREGRLRLRDLEELERYCYFVAGTVGKLLTALFEQEVPLASEEQYVPIRSRAVSFGIALQIVNIVKDVAEDFARGDCFLPEAVAAREGIPLDAILCPDNRSAGLRVIGAICARARDHLRRAVEYTMLWPVEEGREVRMFCTVPLALALATLHEVENGGDTLVPGKTPKVSRDCVQRVFADSQRAIGANDTLRWMLSYYGSGDYRHPLRAACESRS